MIIGNKCDIENRAITTDRAQELCIKCGIPFFEVSAKADTNIETSFYEMTLRILEKVCLFISKFLPSNEFRFVLGSYKIFFMLIKPKACK
jgi:hypothetical protein